MHDGITSYKRIMKFTKIRNNKNKWYKNRKRDSDIIMLKFISTISSFCNN